MERVEHQLTREAEQVDRTPAVFGEERSRRGEVLAVHDLGRFVRCVLVGTVAFGETGERSVEVAELLVGITGLTQLVATRVPQGLDALADRRIRMVGEPAGCLHDVGVGVVHDPPRRVVRHGVSLPAPGRRR